jgi:DNA invertase Pin-like site-specific DNA recombinase
MTKTPALHPARFNAGRMQKIFTDKVTGEHAKRPELAKCLKALKVGDVLIV